MSAPVRMCSGPSSSRICVPDAALLPSTGRPVRRENSAMMSGGKPVGKHRKRTIEHDAHHFPVAGDRVLAGRRLGHAPDRARTDDRSAAIVADRRDAPQAERAQRRQRERHPPRDVAEGVAALVAVRRRIRQFADADAVEHDDDGSSNSGENFSGRSPDKPLVEQAVRRRRSSPATRRGRRTSVD